MANQIKFDVGFNINKSDLNTLTSALKNIQNEVNKAKITGNLIEELKTAGAAASQLESILNQAWNSKLGQLDLTKVNNSIKSTYGTVANLKRALEGSGAAGSAAYNKFASTVMHTNVQLKESNKIVKEMATTLGNTFRYGISSRIVNDLVGSIQTAFNYTVKLDTSLNDIRIVTGQSADQMERFARQANEASKNLGASTLDYTNAALIYYQQGLSEEEVKARAETTIKAANVTGQRGEEVSEQLTAVWNGYKVTAEETEAYVDKLAAVAATTAADLEELSVGMSKVASAANAMGVDFDDLNAQIATIVSVTRQAPESVGTALKTIYARLGDLKVDGVDEFGVSLGEVSKQLEQMGIQVLDQQGNLRDMTSVIAEVAEKWNTWTEAQRQAAAVAMAGKRQYNNLIALFDNWDMYTDALNTSVEAVGTLQDQQDIYMESTRAHLQQLSTEAQKTYDILFNQDTVNGFADSLTNVLGIFNNFLDALGGGEKAILGLGAIATNVFSEQIGNQLAGLMINRERDQSNRDLEVLKQQVMDAHMSKGENVSAKAAEAEAEELQKTLAIQKGLTQEEYNELMTLQEKIGLKEQERLTLEQNLQIGRDLVGVENDVLSVYESRLKLEQEDLKNQQDISSAIAEQLIKSRESLITNKNKAELEQLIVDLSDAKIISEEQFLRIADNELKTTQDQKRLEEELQQIFNEQNIKVQNQELTVQQLIAAIEAKKQAEAGYEQQLTDEEMALKRQSDEIRRQAELRKNMQTYVRALSSTVMLLQTISSTVSIITDDSLKAEEKFKQIFSMMAINLPMILMHLGDIKNGLALLTSEMGLFTSAEAAGTAGFKGMASAAVAAAGPIGAIIGILGGVAIAIALIGAAIDKQRDNFANSTRELVKNTEALKNESDAHKELVDQFNDLKEQYDKGKISKDELWDTTDKLIDAYDLESGRLAALIGDYEEFTKVVRSARDAEEEELLKSQTEAYNKSGKVAANDAAKGWFDRVSATDNVLTVGVNDYTSSIPDEEDQKINEIFKKNFGTTEHSFTIDINNASEVLEFYNQLLGYQKDLEEANLSTTWALDDANNLINQFNSGEGLQQALQQQKELIDTTLNMSHLDEAIDEVDFESRVSELRESLLKIIPDENQVHDTVVAYASKLNTELANSFIIEDSVKQKYGEEISNALLGAIEGYDEEKQAKLVAIDFDWSKIDLQSQEGKEKLDNYVKYITGSEDGVYSIPFGLQMGMDETILKGKDINKSDWESMTSTVPNAEETLGSREEFNNKSIGERITLMEELNQKIQESASLAIEEYDAFKQGAEERKADIEAQIEGLKTEIALRQQNIESLTQSGADVNSDAIEEQKEKVKELSDQIQELTSEEHEIDIAINTSLGDDVDDLLGGMINEVTTQTDALIMAAESVGDAWSVAADDVANFASVFPELMADVNNFDWLEDGSIRLTELGRQMLNETLENNQQIMNSNKEVVLQALDDKIAELEADAEYQQKKITALENYLNTSTTETDAAQKAIAAIEQAGAEYEESLREQGLIQEAAAQSEKTNIADQGNVGLVQGLDSLNENINAVRENYANIFNENYHGVLPGYKGGSVSVSSGYQKGTYGAYEGNDQATQEAVQRAKDELQQAKDQLSEDQRQIAAYRGAQSQIRQNTSKANQATDRVQAGHAGKESSGKGGGGKKGGSSKTPKETTPKEEKEKTITPKDKKELNDEFDRYWALKKAIDAVDKALARLEKRQKNTYGWELIKSLKQENELLEKQTKCYNALAKAQKAEAKELRGQLSTMGVAFSKQGEITNYAEAAASALNTYNAAIEQYNAGALDDVALQATEKSYENFKKLLTRYDSLYYTEMQDTKDKLEDLWRQELENNFKIWETKIQVKLDWKELQRGWKEFLKEIKTDFKKVFKDLTVESKVLKENAKTYVDDDGTIMTQIEGIKHVRDEIDKMMEGQKSDEFETISQAQEKLKTFNEDLQKSAKELRQLYESAWDNYLEGIDQVNEKLETVQKRYDNINDELEFQKQLIDLIYGDKAYDLKGAYYNAQYQINSSDIESVKIQLDTWKQLFEESGANIDNMEDWSKDQQKYYDNWLAAQQKLNDLTLEQIKLLRDQYTNAVEQVIKATETALTNDNGLDNVKSEWERITKYSDKYYDDVEKAYQIQTYANKLNKSISEQSNLEAQKKLTKLRDQELADLHEKKKLTEYDIQAANLRYELALKEIALQNSENNKTNMKLTRNEQGNWSYQYIADEDDVATKKQELLDTYNELYQLASDAYEKNLSTMQELEESYLEKIREIANDQTLTVEERQEKLQQLAQEFQQDMQDLQEENAKYRTDLSDASAGLILEIYKQDADEYEKMTDAQKQFIDTATKQGISDYQELREKAKDNIGGIKEASEAMMKDTRDDWHSKAQEMIDLWEPGKSDSVTKAVNDGINSIIKADDSYQESVNKLEEQVGRDFGEEGIKGALDRATEATQNLETKTEELCSEGIQDISELKDIVDDLEDAWKRVQSAIEEAISLIEEYLQKQYEAESAANNSSSSGGGGGITPSTTTTTPSSTGDTSTAPATSDNSKSGSEGGPSKGGSKTNLYDYETIYGSGAGEMVRVYDKGTDHSVGEMPKSVAEKEYGNMQKHKSKNKSAKMATGGYTGSWNMGDTEGRYALLHQKELVLNKEDTENFLSGINTIRDLASVNGSIEKSIMQAVLNTASQLGNISAGSVVGSTYKTSSEATNNTFNIIAEFPNANSVDEIRQAILTLPNLASQYINSNLK